MSPELSVLLFTALTLGVVHTAVGLDHTLPFVLLGRARSWSLAHTLGVASLCGMAHVMSSVVIGLLGATVAIGLASLSWFEQVRGSWSAIGLILFGVAYSAKALWDIRFASPHRHVHIHKDGTVHRHLHGHGASHAHWSSLPNPARSGVTITLLVVFLLGPCEALLPLMTAPSLMNNPGSSLLVGFVFGGATLTTMIVLITLGWYGLRTAWLERLEPHMHWLAGIIIALSGLGLQFGGL
jgi:nickel/cobalt transporter (NicO) family protein